MIVVSGLAHCGKDTIADHLVSHHGYTKMALAEPLKEACREIFGFSDAQLYGDLKEVIDPYWGKTPRQCFQFIGTELFRDKFDKDIWIKSLVRKIRDSLDRQKIVISDIRFENELQRLKDLGTVISLRVIRDIPPDQDFRSHASEQIQDIPYDHLILNNGTLEELYTKIDSLMKMI